MKASLAKEGVPVRADTSNPFAAPRSRAGAGKTSYSCSVPCPPTPPMLRGGGSDTGGDLVALRPPSAKNRHRAPLRYPGFPRYNVLSMSRLSLGDDRGSDGCENFSAASDTACMERRGSPRVSVLRLHRAWF